MTSNVNSLFALLSRLIKLTETTVVGFARGLVCIHITYETFM